MEETKGLRTDFQPLIENFVTKLWEHWDNIQAKEQHFGGSVSTNWFEPLFSRWIDQDSFFKSFCNLTSFEPTGFRDEQIKETLIFLAENFQASTVEFESAMQSYIVKVNTRYSICTNKTKSPFSIYNSI